MRISNTARRWNKRVEKGSKSNRATAASLRRAIFYLHLHHRHRILANRRHRYPRAPRISSLSSKGNTFEC